MTTYNTLSIQASVGGYDAYELSNTEDTFFLYRNSIDKVIFCADTSLFGTSPIKVYSVFEDLL